MGPHVSLSDALFHAVASTVGAILVFPGASDMELGKSTPSPPFLKGLGWALAVWTIAPTFAVCGSALLYLLLRNMIMRNEDPLHTVIWVSLPLLGGRTVWTTLYQCMRHVMLYVLELPGCCCTVITGSSSAGKQRDCHYHNNLYTQVCILYHYYCHYSQ